MVRMAQDGGNQGEKGCEDAHTRGVQDAGAAAPGDAAVAPGDAAAGPVDLAESVKQLAAELAQAGGDQLDLLDGSPDLDDLDTLAQAANKVAAQRRARGRPQGSPNRRNAAVFDYLAQLGHRHPAVTLSLIQTADTLQLAAALGSPMMRDGRVVMVPVLGEDGRPIFDEATGEYLKEPAIQPADPVKVLEIQRKAAADLLPFDLAKRKELDVKRTSLHMFVAGSLDTSGERAGQAGGGLSIFGGQTIENQPLGEGPSVRDETPPSHEMEKPSDNSDVGS